MSQRFGVTVVFLFCLFAGRSVWGQIPGWAQKQIDETYARFIEWKGSDLTIAFPIVTDIHSLRTELADPIDWSDSKTHIYFAEEAATRFGADFIADLGDIGLDNFNAPFDQSQAEKRLDTQSALYSRSPVPVLFAMGNHDHNGKGWNVTSKLFGEKFNGTSKQNGVPLTLGPNSDYGWYDIPDKKCRVVFLNSSDDGYYGYSTDQLQFLADGLRLPEGFAALVIQHFCVLHPIGMWKSYPDSKAKRGELCMKILDDFVADQKGEEDGVRWDFTENKSCTFAGLFCGDSHFDNQAKVNGVNYIVTQGYGGVNPAELPQGAVSRPFNRAEQMLIDVVAIKPAKKEIRIFRIGIGGEQADRRASYGD